MKGKSNAYDHQAVEAKWQKKWAQTKLYSPDVQRTGNKFYNLWMFPYPSAEGLHAGHAFASTGSDIYGRYMRMQGKGVFQPIGYDSFGIHSENYAIKIGQDPHEVVKRTTKHYEEQMRALGHGYDWSRTVTTSSPDYYHWTQWLFIQLFNAGLAYKKKAPVNWCPSCKTVLADEQVIAGACERCQAKVEKKELEQWFFAITKYADRLLAGLDKIDWSERVKVAQRNWIGKSEGMLIKFQIPNSKFQIEVFTTRPDTLNAVTFLATSKLYREGSKEKVGVFSGKYAVNPLDGRKIPIWDTNYVAPDYGTGIIMGVPAHDERDMEFARKYRLDILMKDPEESLWQKIEKEGWGKRQTNYHLRDWLVSRQRYWGAPIPMIYCQKCHWLPVPETDLPVLLPEVSDYRPEGTGKGPLANHPEFYNVACPECGGAARRETDVMDTFVDSSWYFLRYPSVGLDTRSLLPRVSRQSVTTTRNAAGVRAPLGNSQIENSLETGNWKLEIPWNREITRQWLPVDLYFGGAEHSVLHLMYARFVTMVLSDLGYLNFEEPFPRFFAHGLMIKDGAKMSKSRGNVVNPDEYIAKYGADTLRLYLMFMGPMDGSPDFRDAGIEGMRRFVKRLWRAFHSGVRSTRESSKTSIAPLQSKLHRTIKKVTEDIEKFGYNTAIAAMMEFLNLWEESGRLSSVDAQLFAKLLAPFAPHLAEEAWHSLAISHQPLAFDSVHLQPWPKYDPKLVIEEKVTIVIQVNGKVRGQLTLNSQPSTDERAVKPLAINEQKVSQYLKGQQVRKVVFVPGKLINFVTN